MSHIKEAHTSESLARALSVSRQAIWQRARNEKWSCTQRSERLGGNLYPYASLPDDVKAAIVKHEANKVPQKILAGAVIPDWSHRIGLARYQIITVWRSYCRNSKGKKTAATEAFLQAYNSGKLAKEAFEVLGITKKSSLYNWEKTLRENGDDYYAICDRRGKWDREEKRSEILPPEAAEAFLACWLNPRRPSVTLAARGMEAALIKQGLPVPSLSSVYRYSERYESNHKDIVVLKREGEKALKDDVMPWIKRASGILEVGDCLFADGHTLNFECLHPETGRPFRPTLLLWYDWASRMPVGWEIMVVENTTAVSSGLLMGIKNLGKMPRVVYLDNGKAFKNKYFRGTNPDFEMLSGLYARLGIAIQFAMPYNARAKVVERVFEDFNEQFERLMVSYSGNSIGDKPAYKLRNEPYHTKRQAGRSFYPTLSQAMELFRLYVAWYAGQPHPHVIGKTRGEVFKEGQGPGVDVKSLNYHFMWSKKTRPRKAGITLAKTRYESDALYGLDKEVVIKWSWADLSEIYVYDLDGQYLCKALPQVEVHPLAKHFGTEHDQAMVAEANRRLAGLKKKTMTEARRLDDALDQRPGFSAIGYLPERIEPAPIAAEEPVYTDMSEEERARLEAVYENAVKDGAIKPALERPLWFVSEYERYDWLFENSREGYQLTAEDLAFMDRYEISEEYLNITGARYEQLKEHYGQTQDNGVRQ